ncbi:MAG: hypothetical protein M9941_06025 [Anaerolineae bacterium]|nr:hypothetical protein [Anaerolineae bacterium]MCO5197295.1 hypothetical protein [Anaerolineae bacterium]
MYTKAFNYALLAFSLLVVTLLAAFKGVNLDWRGPAQILLILLILGGVVHLGLSAMEGEPEESAETHMPSEFDQTWG